MTKANILRQVIAFQGVHGAYSDKACRAVFPELTTLPCGSFEDTFAAVREGKAQLAMIPIENSSAGRVADIHHLLPTSGLHIIGEHFQKVDHQLLAPKGATLESIKRVHSHVQALAQVRNFLRDHGIEPVNHADTAGAAAEVAEMNDPAQGAIASDLAAEIYGLDTIRGDVHDLAHNTTRFIIMAEEPLDPDPNNGPVVTTFVFRVRSVPAALYKGLGGFATNGVNITKLESYIIDGGFTVAQFYADIEGHPDERSVRLALEELSFFSKEVKILGVYPANGFRDGNE
ncbi:prephenate dehydratase [Denitrobaculum tricleocarpae]|uniref:prephenate dehydratase n=1 Tax=Denitrobaculum tricleocarpae TaxID=2591009 RepID=A0A545U1B2_9PROT|nr:prephenate dehydratase [Denitrobaculum tricleocarpae]TQV83255.1 prephenate dehydratase [Denitrobaculum tricleocarpae]